MNGLEKITQRIEADAQAEAERCLAQAREEARGVTERYLAQAREEREAIRAAGEEQAARREERMESAAALEGRKLLLEEKQRLLSETFDLALKKLTKMDREGYAAFLTELLVKAAVKGRETVYFNAKDRDTIGKDVVAAANGRLRGKDGGAGGKIGALVDKVTAGVTAGRHGEGLTLGQEAREIAGGFILADGPVEINCGLEALLEQQREKLSGQVAALLFEGAAS